jgi:hypothetical protein
VSRKKGEDPQRNPAYAWEAAFENFNVSTLTLAECQKLANAALDAAGSERVAIQQGPSNRYSWCVPKVRIISMQGPSRKGRGGMNRATVLHECAHQITHDLCGDRAQDHGPMWLTIYRGLLLEHGVITATEFKLTSRKFGLRWNRKAS